MANVEYKGLDCSAKIAGGGEGMAKTDTLAHKRHTKTVREEYFGTESEAKELEAILRDADERFPYRLVYRTIMKVFGERILCQEYSESIVFDIERIAEPSKESRVARRGALVQEFHEKHPDWTNRNIMAAAKVHEQDFYNRFLKGEWLGKEAPCMRIYDVLKADNPVKCEYADFKVQAMKNLD